MLQVSLPLRRDGTDGQAEVFWSLQPLGPNRADLTDEDLQPISGSVIFLSGQSDASINFTIMADDIPEVNETLLLTLDRYEFTQRQVTAKKHRTCAFLWQESCIKIIYLSHSFLYRDECVWFGSSGSLCSDENGGSLSPSRSSPAGWRLCAL